MGLVFQFAIFIAVLGLFPAAFAYFFDARGAPQLMKIAVIAGLALLFIPYLVAQLFGGSDSLQVLAGLIVLSITAYFIRESRNPRKEPPRKTGHAERTPILPSRENEQ